MKKFLSVFLCLILITTTIVTGNNEMVYAGYDRTAPIINSISLSKDSLTKPGTFKLTFDVTEEDTGVSKLYVSFMSSGDTDINDINAAVGRNIEDTYSSDLPGGPYYNEKFTLEYRVSSKYPADDLQIGQIDIYDKQGNHRTYWMGWQFGTENGKAYLSDVNNDNIKCYINNNNTMKVKSEFDVDFQSYVTNPNVTSKIKNMGYNKTAMITFDNSHYTAKKEWFDAIRGTEKTLVFSDDGIQWVFYGKNIKNTTKNISLKTSMRKVSGKDYGIDKNVLIITFPNNGTLPGIANFRMKSDYINGLFNVGSQAYVYYQNGSDLSLEKNAVPKFVADGSSKWAYINIDHNSTFVLSAKKLSKKVKTKIKSARLSPASYVYNGKYRTPRLVVKATNGKTLKRNKDYTVNLQKRKNVGKYAVKIKFKGTYSGTRTLYFVIKPKGTNLTKLTSKKKKITIKWKKRSGKQLSGYEVQYSTSKKFSKKNTKTSSVKKTASQRSISKLKSKKRYYVRIRTYKIVKFGKKKIKIYSSWSKTKNIVVK